jgi:integrase
LNSGLLHAPQTISLGLFIEEHLRFSAGQVAARTHATQALALKNFRAWAGDVRLSAVSHASVERFVAHRSEQVRPATVNKDVRTLRSAFEHGRRLGYVQANPFAGRRPLREPERALRVLTEDEVMRLLAACPGDGWLAFVLVALTTGMRRGELTALRWEDVDFEAGRIVVTSSAAHRTKSGRSRVAVLAPAAAAALRRLGPGQGGLVFHRDGHAWGRRTLEEFGRIVGRAGIARCTLHDLRRTFCSWMAMTGANEAIVQDLAGHASMGTTRRYYQRILPEAHTAAAAKLPWSAVSAVSKSYQGDQAAEGA